MSEEQPWRYEIQHGPDGETNYAWVYDGSNNMVCTAKTHHAIAIVNAAELARRSSPAQAAMPDGDGWNYYGNPPDGTDCRKLVTLVAGDMTWIGIRAFHHANRRWMNNGEPERDTVKAWRDLPEIARGFWQRGELRFPGQDEQEMRERLEAVLRPMVGWSAPAEGDPND